MKKIVKKTEKLLKLTGEYITKVSWGGELKKGYIHYVTPTGEKISLKLGKD